MDTKTSFKCAQCGSDLIHINTVTEKLDGALFPQTTSTYRCSNSECQERRDKEMEKRSQLRKEKEIADQKRIVDRQRKRITELQEKGHYS